MNKLGFGGKCGIDLFWETDGTTLTISGTGDMDDYAYRGEYYAYDPPWSTDIERLIINKGVTRIGSCAFTGCTHIREVTVPDGVTGIGGCAFEGCTGLRRAELPSTLAKIGGRVFFDCGDLEEISISPENKTFFGEGGALYAKELKSLLWVSPLCSGTFAIPDGVTEIGGYAFAECTGLTGVTIPAGVTKIGEYAFSGCGALRSITIPDGVTDIGQYAFCCCSGLETVTMPSGMTGIGQSAFTKCVSLSAIAVPSGVRAIENSTFFGCGSLNSVRIPLSVLYIGKDAFKGCGALTDVFFTSTEHVWNSIPVSDGNEALRSAIIRCRAPEKAVIFSGDCGESLTWTLDDTGALSVSGEGPMDNRVSTGWPWYEYRRIVQTLTVGQGITRIGNSAFSGCTGLTDAAVPDSVTSIGEHAFSDCSGMKHFFISRSVTEIGKLAFIGCKKLEGLSVAPENTCFLGEGPALYSRDRKRLLWFSHAYAGTFKIPAGVREIADHAFCFCGNLSEVTIHEGVERIGVNAFASCSAWFGSCGLKRMTIPETVRKIGRGAFDGCSGLTEVNIPSGVKRIEPYVFHWCSALMEVTFPEGVTAIEEGAFSHCRALKSVTIPKTVTRIGEEAFCDCSSLTEIRYSGSEEEWNGIEITRSRKDASYGFEKDRFFFEAGKHFNCIALK